MEAAQAHRLKDVLGVDILQAAALLKLTQAVVQGQCLPGTAPDFSDMHAQLDELEAVGGERKEA